MGTIGKVDHSKRTLTYAIQKTLESNPNHKPREELYPFPIDKNSITVIHDANAMTLSKKKRNKS